MPERFDTLAHEQAATARPPRGARPAAAATAALILLLLLAASPAPAALSIDFEQPYYAHAGYQVWDGCLVHDGQRFQLFYHAIPLSDPHPHAANTIWRTSSVDLVHWGTPVPAISVSGAPHEQEAVWAPDVVFDADSALWWLAYTGVDTLMNQRLCLAWSPDLATWHKLTQNPVAEPDPAVFRYDTAAGWAECRDPFLFHGDGAWHLLATTRIDQDVPWQGALAVATSSDLLTWSPLDVFLLNDGDQPDHVLESSGYLRRQDTHHLVFHEQDVLGVQHLHTADLQSWTFASAGWVALGIAPHVTSVDGGQTHHLVRVGHFQDGDDVAFVAHVDTLVFADGEPHPAPLGRHPLSRWFAAFDGQATEAAPTFGDNQARRGLPAVGQLGHGYFSSAEFFQGPLGEGIAGHTLGNVAMGWAETAPLTLTQPWVTLLVGGSERPDACFVALVDAATDSVLRRESGGDQATLIRRWWDVAELAGRQVVLRIEDSSLSGQIMVDDIRETPVGPTTDAPVPALAVDRGPVPNPANPGTTLRCELAAAAPLQARVYDLRGRLVWQSAPRQGRAGINAVAWSGVDLAGRRAAGGTYLYRWMVGGRPRAAGKLALVP